MVISFVDINTWRAAERDLSKSESRYCMLVKIRIRWQECDGPTVLPPQKKGFGTKLIDRASKYELRRGRIAL